MKRVVLSIILLAFAGAVSADQSGADAWGHLKGALSIDRTLSAGSGVGTGSAVDGGLTMRSPGRTTVSAWSLNRTSVRSATTVTRNCGRCSGLSLRTNSHGKSYSAGGAKGVITPRIDPVFANFSAYGDGVAFTEFTRSFELDLSGRVNFDTDFELDD